MKKVGVFFFMSMLFLSIFFNALQVEAIETGLVGSATGVYNTSLTVQGCIGLGIQALLGVVGAIFFGILVYGGILWMFSDGEEKKITKARTMMFYAVAGLLIVLGAYAITKFITDQIATKTLT
jgi:hypothetical protein